MTKEPHRAPEGHAGLAGTSNADKARALIALLESGGGAGAEGIPAARLRDWARDLVETVERAGPLAAAQKPEAKAEPKPEAPAEPKPEPRLTASRLTPPRLFTKAPPVLVDRAPPAPTAALATASAPPAQAAPPPLTVPPAPVAAAPVMAVPVTAPPVVAPMAAYAEAARASGPRMILGAPMPHTPPRPRAGVAARPAILSRQEVDRLVASTVDPAGDPAGLAREHPAIVAMTLVGKPTLQQAAMLRALPGAQMRAVHRALRQLEAQQS